MLGALYTNFFKRTSGFAVIVFGGALLFQESMNPIDTWFAEKQKGRRYEDLPPKAVEE